MADRRATDYERDYERDRGQQQGDYERGSGSRQGGDYYEGERWAEQTRGRQMEERGYPEAPRWMGAPYDQSSYPQGANYGQGYASQGGSYGGRRAGGYQWNYAPEYGQESRYGDEWRGREQGFRGSDRGGQEWRTPDYGWRSQYADVGGQGRYQDYGAQRYTPNYERRPSDEAGGPNRYQDFGMQRYGPPYERRYWGDQDRWYGEGGWGREGSQQRSPQLQGGEYEPARMAYDEDYWQDHRPGEYWRRHPEYRHGPHAGKGPRGYQRSDKSIEDEACEMLKQHGHIDATEINVSSMDGVVTLSGNVDDRRQKRMAEDVVEDLSGVKDVNNQLRVGNQPDSQQGSMSSQKSGSSPQTGSGQRATAQSSSVQNGKTTTAGRK